MNNKNIINIIVIFIVISFIIYIGIYIKGQKEIVEAKKILLINDLKTVEDFEAEIVFGKTKQELFNKRERLERVIKSGEKLTNKAKTELRYTILAIRCNASQAERALLGKKVIEGFCDNKENLESFSEVKGL